MTSPRKSSSAGDRSVKEASSDVGIPEAVLSKETHLKARPGQRQMAQVLNLVDGIATPGVKKFR